MKSAVVLLLCIAGVYAQEPFWKPSYGPVGGTINAMVALPNGSILAATKFGGVFASGDRGGSWNFAGLPGQVVASLARSSSGSVFAASLGDGVSRSTDGGRTWQTTSMPEQTVHALAVNGQGFIFAGGGLASVSGDALRRGPASFPTSSQGIYRSTDDGETWIPVGLQSISVYALAVDSTSVLFAGTWQRGLYRSSDNGTSWVSVGFADSTFDAVAAQADGSVLAATRSGVIYRSSGRDSAWTKVAQLVPSIVSISPGLNGHAYAASGDGVFRTMDYGVVWSRFGLEGVTVRCAVAGPQGTVFSGASGGGIYRTQDDGATWSPVNCGLSSTATVALGVDRRGNVFAGTSESGLFRTTDRGSTWLRRDLPIAAPARCLATDSKGGVLVGAGSSVYRSSDGETWSKSLNADGAVTALAIDSSGITFALASGVYRSSDEGLTWTKVSPNVSGYTMTIDRLGGIFVGGRSGIIRSQDGGASWNSIYGGATDVVHITGTAGGIFLAATASGVILRSTDGGNTWQELPGAIAAELRSIYVDPAGDLYLSSSRGIFRSADGGYGWSPMNDGLQNLNVVALTRDNEGYLYAGTQGNGVSRTSSRIISSVRWSTNEVPSRFILVQNYPNPFNPSTTISFAIPRDAAVRLEIFDVMGRKVRTLLDGRRPLGHHSIAWNGRSDSGEDVSSGVYFYHFVALPLNGDKAFKQSGKLMLTR